MLQPVTRYEEGKTPAREVLPFLTEDEAAVPYQEYTNVLYLYPEALNFSNYKGAESSARNILIGVSLLRGDSGLPEERVPGACYPCRGALAREDEAFVAVQYHQRKPRFCALDEVKVELPHSVTKKDHILVTFYHVDCKRSKECALTALGNSVIPLVERKGHVLHDGEHSYPVVFQPRPGYIAKVREAYDHDTDGDLFWVDGRRDLFTVRTKILSCIYPRNEALDTFLSADPAAHATAAATAGNNSNSSNKGRGHKGNNMARITEEIGTATSIERALFFPHMVGKLLELVAEDDAEVAPVALRKLTLILGNVYDDICSKPVYVPLLEHYVHCVYSGVTCPGQALTSAAVPGSGGSGSGNGNANSRSSGTSFAAVFARQWVATLARASDSLCAATSKYSWFLFSILFKDMVFEAARKGLLNDPDRSKRVPAATMDVVAALVAAIADIVAAAKPITDDARSVLNISTALFLTRLLDIADRGRVFEIFQRYIDTIHKQPTTTATATATATTATTPHQGQLLAFTAIRVLFNHPQAMQLNLPVQDVFYAMGSVEPVLYQNHFLSSILLREVRTALRSPVAEVRDAAQETLFYALRRVEDATTRASKHLVFAPFFLFVTDFIDSPAAARIKDRNLTPEDLKRTKVWLTIFLQIVKLSLPTLKWWLAKDVKSRTLLFLDILPCIAYHFRYTGKKDAPLIYDFVPSLKDVTLNSPAGIMTSAAAAAAAAPAITAVATTVLASTPPSSSSSSSLSSSSYASSAVTVSFASSGSGGSSSTTAITTATSAGNMSASPVVIASPIISPSPLASQSSSSPSSLSGLPVTLSPQPKTASVFVQRPFRSSGIQPRGQSFSDNDGYSGEMRDRTPSMPASRRSVRIVRHKTEMSIFRHSQEVGHVKRWGWEAKKRSLTIEQLELMVNDRQTINIFFLKHA